MSVRYLQRLLDAEAPAPMGGSGSGEVGAAPALRPAMPSASPLFERDPLLGLLSADDSASEVSATPLPPRPTEGVLPLSEEPEAPATRAPSTAAPEAHDASAPAPFEASESAPAPIPRPDSRLTPATDAIAPLENHPVMDSLPDTAPVTPAAGAESSVTEPGVVGLSEGFAERPSDTGALEQSARSPADEMPSERPAHPQPQRVAPSPARHAAFVEPRAGLTQPASNRDVITQAPVLPLRPVPQPAPETQPSAPHADAWLVPSPRDLAEAPVLPREVEAEAPAAAPRVEIGRVIVEAPPPAETPATQTPPRPATAEALSQIGPIGDLRAGRLMFGLRRG